ncbi:PAS domain S-box protein [Leptolyngbya sp. FACHB-541]|uniref:PAS domain S-box protein n=1 Tax=Leptolyngbya sp. FACHB-541 TaxID=2692810 RepID=UPI001682236E|nr:PAS domain S-box protein [Leptolyngbya sp. FACHB-541]MBD1995923.1 PAS domain S-box protein [Leptolyngbya sp. FACHB-541]
MMTTNSPLLSYGVAWLSVALASAVSLLLGSLTQPTPLALFYMAVIVSAWYGGLKPGLVATVLSTLAINYFISPYNALGIVNPGNLLRLGVFVIIALLISGLDQARQAALRQEQQLRVAAENAHRRTAHLLEHMTDAFVVFDRHWRYTYVNPAALQLLQKSLEELIGKNVWEVFPSEKGGFAYGQLHRALEEQVSVSWEEFGEPVQRWLEVRAYPSPEGIAIYFQDISERKQAEEALRQSEEQLRLATEAANLGLWHWDVLHDRLVWTDQCKALFGLPADTETSYQVFLNAVYPDDRQRIQEMRPVLEDGQLEHHEIEYRTLWSDGTVRWLMARGSASYDAERKPIFSRGVIFDITDRKQAELALRAKSAELRHVTETAGIGLTRCSRDLRYLSANPAYAQLAGMTVEEIVGKPIVEVMGETAFEVIRPYINRVLRGERVEYEAQVPFAAGEMRDLYVVYMPDEDSNGNIVGWIASVIDISDRKRIEEELRKSEQQLRSAIEVAQFSPYEWNPVTGELIWDAPLKAMWGLAPDAEVNYAVHAAGLHPEDREYVEQQTAKAIDPNSDGIFEAEFRVIGIEDGIERWILARGQTFFDAERRPIYYVGVAQDISDRKRVEEDLCRSEAAFRTISNAAPALVWVCSPEGENILFNDRWYEFTGQTEAEAFGLGWAETMHPDDAARILPYWKRCQQTGETYEGEVRYRRHDGEYRWHVFRALPRRNTGGDIEAWYGLSFDISERKRVEDERKQAEIALRESEHRFRRLVESNMFGVAFGNFAGDIHGANDYFLNMVGYTREEIETGQVKWIDITPPEFLPLDEQAMAELRMKGVAIPFEKEYICKDGSRVPILIGSALLDEPYDQHQEMIAFYVDLSNRKQAEIALRESEAIARIRAEELETLMEVVPVGIWLAHGPDCRQVTVNRGAYNLMRAEPGDPTTATPADDIYPFKFKLQSKGQDIPAEELSLQKAGRTGQEVVQEAELVFEDGVVHYMYGRAVPLRDEAGNVRGVIGAYVDISERKQAEAEREQLLAREQAAREEAERANRIKDEFLAVLSHELRSPLNPILGWSRLLQNGKLDELRTKQALATIERNAKLQSELIEDLLDVSRILQGKLSLTVSPIDLKLTIQAAIETVRLAAEAKSIAIETRLDSEIGLVSGDSTRLQQVVWNLLSNAVKFTPTGGQVTVQLEQVDDHAQITVRDTGKGISANFLPYVFDYFRQADSTTTRKFGGLGLGLAIVRHLVELHGGTIQADSPGEGSGATFTVRLPLMANEITVSRAFPLSKQPLSLQGIQILVVDDETDTRDLIAFLLEQAGASVATAASASEALTLLIRSKPDLLVSDIGMPEMNGYMLMQQIRTLPPDQGGQVKAIALTAYAGDFDQQQALQAGFQRHLAKPIDPQELIQAISALCNSTETWQKPNF